jgi:hypothetical protein
MKRNSAQAGEGKLESRFAALTSGLLARKGFAAPSNSPIHDPAEETDPFALEPTHKADKKKTPAPSPPKAPAAETKPAAKEAAPAAETKPPAREAAPAVKKPPAAPEPPAAKKAERPAAPAKPAPVPELKLQQAERVAAPPITIINERSSEAGYPDNPSPEEIAALDAEADEVVSYFENFGNEDAVAIEKDSFYGGAADDPDELGDFDDDDAPAPAGEKPTGALAGPWAGSSVPAVAAGEQVRAGVTVQLTAREFMRLSLGARELGQSAQELIAEAIEEYLDARGVISLGGCSCLDALANKPSGSL